MLAEVLSCLSCPVCGDGLALGRGAVACERGHSFDVARQGYVNLLPAAPRRVAGDTAAMLDARDAFLRAGHFDRIATAVAEAALDAERIAPAGCVVDVGAGTGFYLAAVLDALPERSGLALDVSKFAARRAARAHPRAAAVVGDTWTNVPVRSGAAALLLDVFAPRNAAEFARVLAAGGALIVVTPAPEHLRELVDVLGMLHVPEDKLERLDASLAEGFALVRRTAIEYEMELAPEDVANLVAMGPSAWHAQTADLAERAAALGETVCATSSVVVSTFLRSE